MGEMLRVVVVCCIIFVVHALGKSEERPKRQTYIYDESLKAYAFPHPGTKVHQGYLNRYAPQDWPSWYSRNMMKWTGEFHTSPYHKTDPRYTQWHNDFVRRNA